MAVMFLLGRKRQKKTGTDRDFHEKTSKQYPHIAHLIENMKTMKITSLFHHKLDQYNQPNVFIPVWENEYVFLVLV